MMWPNRLKKHCELVTIKKKLVPILSAKHTIRYKDLIHSSLRKQKTLVAAGEKETIGEL